VPEQLLHITCRECGAEGYETRDDPCPGLCPWCFDEALAAETTRLLAEQASSVFSRETLQRRHEERLRRLGATEAVIERERRMVDEYRRRRYGRE
jgi:hypothetical protein